MNNDNLKEKAANDFSAPEAARTEINSLLDRLREVSMEHKLPVFCCISLGKKTELLPERGEDAYSATHELIGGVFLPEGRSPEEMTAMAVIQDDGLMSAMPKLALLCVATQVLDGRVSAEIRNREPGEKTELAPSVTH